MSGKEQWEAETVAKALTKGPERRTVFETTSGIPVERLYTPEDAAGGYEERLGYPGQYPLPAESSPPCTAGASGRCGSMPALPQRRSPTSGTAICWSRADGPVHRL